MSCSSCNSGSSRRGRSASPSRNRVRFNNNVTTYNYSGNGSSARPNSFMRGSPPRSPTRETMINTRGRPCGPSAGPSCRPSIPPPSLPPRPPSCPSSRPPSCPPSTGGDYTSQCDDSSADECSIDSSADEGVGCPPTGETHPDDEPNACRRRRKPVPPIPENNAPLTNPSCQRAFDTPYGQKCRIRKHCPKNNVTTTAHRPCFNKCGKCTTVGPPPECEPEGNYSHSDSEYVSGRRRHKYTTMDECPKEGSDFKLITVYVPGTFPNLDDALDSLRDDVEGYQICLKRGTHVLNRNHNMDVKTLRIVGDPHPTFGVGYLQSLGAGQCVSQNFQQQRNTDVSGLGPWFVSAEGGEIMVKGAVNPDFSSVPCGSKLVFYQGAGPENKKFTTHRIHKGKKNKLYLHDCLTLYGDGNIAMGDGFFILPSVNIKTCCSIKLTVQDRLEYSGVNLQTVPMFVTGATAGAVELDHIVNSGNLTLVSTGFDSYKPFVSTCKVHMTEGSGGGAMWFGTYIGTDAGFEAGNIPATDMSYSIFAGCLTGAKIMNGAHATFSFTDFFACSIAGLHLINASVADIRGSRFINNLVGHTAERGSSITSLPTYNLPPQPFEPTYSANLAFAQYYDYNSMGSFDGMRIYTSPGQFALYIDDDPPTGRNFSLVPGPTDYVSGTIMPKHSYVIFTVPIPIPPIV